MPTTTPNLGIPLPLGTETASRQAILDAFMAVDAGSETPAGAQDKADDAMEALLGVYMVKGVSGFEPDQVETSMGPAVEFIDGATKKVQFSVEWPWTNAGCKLLVRLAAGTANAGTFRLQVGYQINGGAQTDVAVSVTPGNDTNMHITDLGQVVPAESLTAGDLITFTFSRLGADAADTHTGKLRLYYVKPKRVVA